MQHDQIGALEGSVDFMGASSYFVPMTQRTPKKSTVSSSRSTASRKSSGTTIQNTRSRPRLTGKANTGAVKPTGRTKAVKPSTHTVDPTNLDRRPKGWLEAEVVRVTNAFAKGKIKLEESELLTPHRISKQIALNDPTAAKGSPGAITNTLRSWAGLGYAVINEKPVAFLGLTETGETKGLEALRQSYRDAAQAEREAKRAATEEAQAKAARAAERAAKKAEREAATTNA